MRRTVSAVVVILSLVAAITGLAAPGAQAAPGNALQGTVSTSGSGVNGATVAVIQGNTFLDTTTTGPDGSWAISGLADGTYYVIASKGGFLPVWSGLSVLAPFSGPVHLEGNEAEVVDFTLPISFCTDAEGGPFPDVGDTHSFCLPIDWAVYGGLVNGFADGTYRPGGTLTRQAQAAIIYRYYGEPTFDPPAVPTFSDVGPTHPFRTEVEWLYAIGLTNGFGDGTFRPGSSITRQAMTAFLHRMAGSPFVLPPGTPHFSDVPLDHPFYDEIEWAYANNLVLGFDGGTFRPGNPITRQALASLMFRYDGNYPAFFPSGPPT